MTLSGGGVKYQTIDNFLIPLHFHKNGCSEFSAFCCKAAYAIFGVIAVTPVRHFKSFDAPIGKEIPKYHFSLAFTVRMAFFINGYFHHIIKVF